MFNSIKSDLVTTKTTTIITGTGIAAGLIYGMAKKKSFWGVVACTLGFGLAGAVISTVVSQFTQKT